jgi:hypothetical protein
MVCRRKRSRFIRTAGNSDRVPDLATDLTVYMYEIGNRDEGLKYFKRACERRVVPSLMVQHYPVWEKVIADPEVQKILVEPPPSPTGSPSRVAPLP